MRNNASFKERMSVSPDQRVANIAWITVLTPTLLAALFTAVSPHHVQAQEVLAQNPNKDITAPAGNGVELDPVDGISVTVPHTQTGVSLSTRFTNTGASTTNFDATVSPERCFLAPRWSYEGLAPGQGKSFKPTLEVDGCLPEGEHHYTITVQAQGNTEVTAQIPVTVTVTGDKVAWITIEPSEISAELLANEDNRLHVVMNNETDTDQSFSGQLQGDPDRCFRGLPEYDSIPAGRTEYKVLVMKDCLPTGQNVLTYTIFSDTNEDPRYTSMIKMAVEVVDQSTGWMKVDQKNELTITMDITQTGQITISVENISGKRQTVLAAADNSCVTVNPDKLTLEASASEVVTATVDGNCLGESSDPHEVTVNFSNPVSGDVLKKRVASRVKAWVLNLPKPLKSLFLPLVAR